MTPRLSIIIPALNEARSIETLLAALQPLRARRCEVIVVDGGSADNTTGLAASLADLVVDSPVGRASQMNAGVRYAQAPVLWFLHADSRIPVNADSSIFSALIANPEAWGFFAIRLSGAGKAFRVIEWAMNQRVRLTHVATGDHGLFVTRALFDRVGGFPTMPLMEDVAISKALRAIRRPIRVPEIITTSSRRWEEHGIVRTILLMWWLRLQFFLGVPPKRLAQQYRAAR